MLSDLYILIPCSFHKDKGFIDGKEYDSDMKLFLDEINSQSLYECSTDIASKLKRTYAGKYIFACFDDDYSRLESDGIKASCKKTVSIDLVITTHHDTGLNIATIILSQNDYDVSHILDQISTNHVFIALSEDDEFIEIKEFLNKHFNLYQVDKPKTLICLPTKPDLGTMCAMLAGEAYDSKHVNYKLASKEMLKCAERNVSQYDFYEAYVSSRNIVYVLHEFGDFRENIVTEVAMLFICELILFQNAAILRTNRRIVSALSKNENITLHDIGLLYQQFGRTIEFWNMDNFNYLAPKTLSDIIVSEFGTYELLNTYQRNQSHLEHLVELKSIQNQEENKKIEKVKSKLFYIITAITTVNSLSNIFLNLYNVLIKKERSGVEALISILTAIMFFAGLWVIYAITARYIRNKKKKHRDYSESHEINISLDS